MKLDLRALATPPVFVFIAGVALGCGGAGNGGLLGTADVDAGLVADGASPGALPPGEDASTDATLARDGQAPDPGEAGTGGDDAGPASPDGALPDGGNDSGCTVDAGAACAAKCGELKDVCGETLECGGCDGGMTCGGGGPNMCGAGPCTASCSGKACGASDGCGGVCDHGACAQGQTCVAGTCTCDPGTCAGCCEGVACRAGTDPSACGKGGAVCQACPGGDTCGGGACKACVPSCAGKACGAGDGCGGTCDTCPAGQRCSAGACVCDASSCPNGCCSGNTCMASAPNACGTSGGACTVCSSNQSCVSGSCINATALWSPPGGFGFSTPQTMLALDPSGQNLYAIDQNNSSSAMIIYKVPTSGAPAQPFASGLNWVVGVAADSSNVYWLSTGDNTVVAKPATGGAARVLATGQYFPSTMTVLDSTTVYWSACNSAGAACEVWQLPVSGGTPTTVVEGPASAAAVVSPNLFLAFPFGVGLIQSSSIGGGGQNAEFDSGSFYYGIAATSFDVAWFSGTTSTTAYNGTVRYLPTASLGQPGLSNQPTTLAVGQYPVSIAMDSSYVYWANYDGTHPSNGSIVKAPIGGGSPTTLVSGVQAATIVVGAQYVYWLGSDGAVSGVFRTAK